MPSRPEPLLSAQEMARQNNENQLVRHVFLRRRRLRKKLHQKELVNPTKPSKKALDRLDWHAAEREARPIRAIGFFMP